MSRVTSLSLAAALAAVALPAAAGEAFTTRIETQNFHGATITIEEGVRVFRPLPSVRHVVVNPGGVTPLNLSYTDVRVDERRTSYNYNYSDSAPAYGGYYGLGGTYYGGFGSGFGKGFHGSRRSPAKFSDGGIRRGGYSGGGKGGPR